MMDVRLRIENGSAHDYRFTGTFLRCQCSLTIAVFRLSISELPRRVRIVFVAEHFCDEHLYGRNGWCIPKLSHGSSLICR